MAFLGAMQGGYWKNIPECFIALDRLPMYFFIYIYCLTHITLINRQVISLAKNIKGLPLFVVFG